MQHRRCAFSATLTDSLARFLTRNLTSAWPPPSSRTKWNAFLDPLDDACSITGCSKSRSSTSSGTASSQRKDSSNSWQRTDPPWTAAPFRGTGAAPLFGRSLWVLTRTQGGESHVDALWPPVLKSLAEPPDSTPSDRSAECRDHFRENRLRHRSQRQQRRASARDRMSRCGGGATSACLGCGLAPTQVRPLVPLLLFGRVTSRYRSACPVQFASGDLNDRRDSAAYSFCGSASALNSSHRRRFKWGFLHRSTESSIFIAGSAFSLRLSTSLTC